MGLMVPVNEVNGLETAMGLGSEPSEEEAAHLGQEWQEVPVVGKGPGLEVVAEELLVGEPVAADAILPVKPRYFLSIGCQFWASGALQGGAVSQQFLACHAKSAHLFGPAE
jgi:hypothetical protein